MDLGTLGLSEIIIPTELDDLREDRLITPEELAYWEARKRRVFYIDYDIDESFRLIELSKIIIQMNMDELNTPKDQLKPIYLWIFSYGGDLEQSMFFCDLIKSSRIPIVTIAMGAAMSGGFLILLAGQKRYAFNHSQILVHAGSAAFQGTASEVEEAQKNYKRQIDSMKDYVLSHTEIDPKVFNKNRNKDWYLTTQDLIDYKIVDKIIESFEDII